MSLEESIQALTAAVIANTVAMGGEFTPTAETATEPAKRGRKPKTTESAPTSPTPPAATAPATGAAAPTTSAPTTSAPTSDPQLLVKTTEAVIKLANEYSRDTAVGILAKRKVTRCSDLPLTELQAVFNEATAEITKADALKAQATANASLV